MKLRFEMTATPDDSTWEINVKVNGREPFTFYVAAATETEALDVAEKQLRAAVEAYRPTVAK